MIAAWILLGVAVLGLASAIWPRWVRIFEPTRSRIPGAPERRIPSWPVQAVSLALAGLAAAITVGLLWNDDETRGIATALAFLVLTIALTIWIIASLAARHDRVSRARRDEPDSPLAARQDYRFEQVGLVVTAIGVFISLIMYLTALDTREAQIDAASSPTPTPAPDPLLGNMLGTFNTVTALPVLGAPPDTGSVVEPSRYAIPDADGGRPTVVLHVAGTDALAGADLILSEAGFSCTAVGVVVVETEESVTVGIAVAEQTPDEAVGPDGIPTPEAGPTPTPAPLDGPPSCLRISPLHTRWYLVRLSAPVGDREVLNYSGSYLAPYLEPVVVTR